MHKDQSRDPPGGDYNISTPDGIYNTEHRLCIPNDFCDRLLPEEEMEHLFGTIYRPLPVTAQDSITIPSHSTPSSL